MRRLVSRLPVDLTLLEGPRLAAGMARVAPWTTPPRLVLIALVSLASLAANIPTSAPGWFDWSVLPLVFWTAVAIALRELGRAAAAERTGRTVDAIRVALRPRTLPAFYTAMQPAWAVASADQRWRITAAGCGLQLGLAGGLALASPLLGGTTSRLAALVIVALALWTALTGERAFLQRPASMRGATIARIETMPVTPKPARKGTRGGDFALASFVLLAFGVPGALCLAYGARQSFLQEQRLLTARPVEAVVVATALVDRTPQKRGATYRPVVRHRFHLHGRTYESEQAHPVAKGLFEDEARAFLAARPVGARVVTHVPAADPAHAYLVPLRQWQFPGMILFGMAFLTPGVLMWGVLLRGALRRGPRLPDADATVGATPP